MKSFLKQKKFLIPAILVLLIILFFVTRSIAFSFVLNKVHDKLVARNLELTFDKAGFAGLRSATFEKLCIKDSLKDTIFFSEKITLKPKLTSLIMGRLGLSEFHLIKSKVYIDPDFFKNKKSRGADSLTSETSGFDDRLRRAFGIFFDYVPTHLDIDDFTIFYKRKNGFSIKIPDLKIKDKNISGYFISTDSLGNSLCNIQGNYDPFNSRFSFSLYGENGMPYKLPYLPAKLNLVAKFDTLKVKFNIVSDDDDELKFEGLFQIDNLLVSNKKISPKEVTTKIGNLSFLLTAGNNFIELDSSSQVRVNELSFHTYARYEKNGHRYVSLQIPSFDFEARQLFESFPTGLFASVRDMQVKGRLNYALDFHIDLDMPDSVRFLSTLTPKGFKIEKQGDANLYLMNDTFSHWVYNPDGSNRIIRVSPTSAGFAGLSEISPYLQFAVLTSEDGGFYYHKGFNEEALAMSISTNIKEGKFKRGGSTVSMQLVKNLYLTRNKTMSRKLEEIFITWMIENLRTVSKERMYEVYLNIIEWGPNIYGIKEASEFYFNKKPWELNLKESIFLASIIPSPRNFRFSFDSNGNLSDLLNGYYKNVSGIMVRRGQIQASDTINLIPEVKLAPSAMKFIQKDTASVIVEEIPEEVFF